VKQVTRRRHPSALSIWLRTIKMGIAMKTQTRARYRLAMYALAIALMTGIAVLGSSWAKSETPRIDVSAMMTAIDVGSLPVHLITDAF